MQRINFRNTSPQTIQIIIEPAAENFELLAGQQAIFESSANKTLDIDLAEATLIIYEEFGSKMKFGETLKMFIDNKQLYPFDQNG